VPEVNAGGQVLGASANYEAEDWGSASGNAELDLKASADLTRGIDLELGAEALVGLDASVSKFLSVDVQGQANAAARVRAQIQVPLDLFDECGLAIRLQAVAEAAASIQLGIGLDLGDFLALAQADPRMDGISIRLLKIFLDEAQISGGVRAKAAAAAMAYANVAVTGRLIDSPSGKAGFAVCAEAGLGLKAGAGYRVYAGFGLNDPSRMIRRSVDALVDDTLERIGDRTTDAAVLTMLDEVRAPAKMALRACFELGSELARDGGTFDPAQAPVIAQRCLQVFFEEAQRYIAQKVADFAFRSFRTSLQTMNLAQQAWTTARPERLALAARLRAMPADPFEPTPESQAYWTATIDESTALARALGGQNQHTEPWVAALATLWAASQLLFVSVGRISSGNARAGVLGAQVDAPLPPFAGAALQPPPPLIRALFVSRLPAGTPPRDPTLEDLVAHVLAANVINPVVDAYPALRVVAEIVGGPGANTADTVRMLMRNLGPFVSQGGGRVDVQRSIDLVLEGLHRYVHARLRDEVEPVLHELIADEAPELRLYLDEVLIATLRFATDVIFAEASRWSAANGPTHKAMREACSALMMQVLGRTLVVTTDVLLTKTLAEMSGALRAAVPQLNRPKGVVEHLAGLVPALDRNTIKDTVTEIFDIAADVFAPLPPEKRARIRELLYEIIDTTPANPGAEFLEALKNDSMIPNAEAAAELALELGGLIADSFTRLIGRILELLGESILAALETTIAAIEGQILAWIDELQGLLEDIGQLLQDLLREIEQLRQAVAAAADALLDQAEVFLGALAGRPSQLRQAVKETARDACRGVLFDIPGYSSLPRSARRAIKDKLDDVLDNVLDNELFNDLAGALTNMSGDLEDFLQDARAIDPNDDVTGALVDLLADRVEDALHDAFGNDVRIPIAFTFRGLVDFEVDLGDVRVKTSDIVSVVRKAARSLQAVTSAAHDLGQVLTSYLSLEQQLDVAEIEEDSLRSRRSDAERRVRETRLSAASVRIVQPGASAAYGSDVPVEIALTGVPASFLDLDGEEAARVFVFLDEVPLDRSLFDVSDRPSATRSIAGSLSSLDAPLAGVLADDGLPPLGAALSRFTSTAPRGNPVFSQRSKSVQSRQTAAASSWSSAPPRPIKAPEARKTGPGRAVQIGSRLVTAPGAATTPGRLPRISLNQRLIADARPDLLLKMTLSAQDLGEGFHTVTVVVTAGSSATRISESVAFYTSPTARIVQPPGRRPTVVPSMPAKPTIPLDELAPALRKLASRGAGRVTRLGAAPAKSTSLVRPRGPEVAKALAVTAKTTIATLKTRKSAVADVRTALKQEPLRRVSGNRARLS